jgi:hypothetical protein
VLLLEDERFEGPRDEEDDDHPEPEEREEDERELDDREDDERKLDDDRELEDRDELEDRELDDRVDGGMKSPFSNIIAVDRGLFPENGSVPRSVIAKPVTDVTGCGNPFLL